MSQNVYRYHGLQIEPQLIGPQGGCYPARINERCWPKNGHLDPIQGKSQILLNPSMPQCPRGRRCPKTLPKPFF